MTNSTWNISQRIRRWHKRVLRFEVLAPCREQRNFTRTLRASAASPSRTGTPGLCGADLRTSHPDDASHGADEQYHFFGSLRGNVVLVMDTLFCQCVSNPSWADFLS